MAKEKTLNEFAGLAIGAGAAALAAGHALGNTRPMKKLGIHIGYEGDRHIAHLAGIETMQANGWDYSHDGGQGKDHHAVWTHPKHGTVRLGSDWWDHKNKNGKTVAKGKPGYDFHLHMVDNKKMNPSGKIGFDEAVDVITKQDRVLKKVLDMRADVKKAFTGGNERSDRFLGKHPVSRTDDPEGNGDDVFKATNVAKDTTNSAKDLLPGEDEYVYEGKEPNIHDHFYAVSARLDSKANKRTGDLKRLYHADAQDYRDIGDLAAAGKHDEAKKKWANLDTASSDNIVDYVDKKYHGQLAKYLNVKIRGVNEEAEITEKLNPKMGAKAYIDDFVHSKDPRFEGKTRSERARMALGAFYGARKKLKEGLVYSNNPKHPEAQELRSKLGKDVKVDWYSEPFIDGHVGTADTNPGHIKKTLVKHGFEDVSGGHNNYWRKIGKHQVHELALDDDNPRHISIFHTNHKEYGLKEGVLVEGLSEVSERSIQEATHLTAFHPSSVKERAGLAAHLGTHWHHDYEGNHVGFASGDSGELHRKMLELGYTPGLSDHPHDARVDARDQDYWKDGDNHTRHRVTFKKRRTSDKLHEVEIEHSR